MSNGIEDKLVNNWSLEDSESVFKDPSSRFRMPKVFNTISRMMGKKLIEGGKKSAGRSGDYILVGNKDTEPYVKQTEEELVKSLFRMPVEINQSSALIKNGKNFRINPSSELGANFQKTLDDTFTEQVLSNWKGFHNVPQGSKKPTTMFKKSVNPDTGKKSFKIVEDVLGDVHIDENLHFSDYWNIGLDKGSNDKSSLKTKAMRAAAAPFTSPPTVTGKLTLSDSILSDFLEKMSIRRKIRMGPKAGQLSGKTEFERKYGKSLPSLEQFKMILSEDFKKSFHEY